MKLWKVRIIENKPPGKPEESKANLFKKIKEIDDDNGQLKRGQ